MCISEGYGRKNLLELGTGGVESVARKLKCDSLSNAVKVTECVNKIQLG